MGMVAAVALQLVQHLQEDAKNQVATSSVVGLAVDVEKNDISVSGDSSLDVGEEQGVCDLALEELDSLLTLAGVRVRLIVEQVR